MRALVWSYRAFGVYPVLCLLLYGIIAKFHVLPESLSSFSFFVLYSALWALHRTNSFSPGLGLQLQKTRDDSSAVDAIISEFTNPSVICRGQVAEARPDLHDVKVSQLGTISPVYRVEGVQTCAEGDTCADHGYNANAQLAG